MLYNLTQNKTFETPVHKSVPFKNIGKIGDIVVDDTGRYAELVSCDAMGIVHDGQGRDVRFVLGDVGAREIKPLEAIMKLEQQRAGLQLNKKD